MVEHYQGLMATARKWRQPSTAVAAFAYPAFPDFDSPVPADRMFFGRPDLTDRAHEKRCNGVFSHFLQVPS